MQCQILVCIRFLFLKVPLLLQMAFLEKDDRAGLGISLEGTVDVEDGREVRPHHYIRSILPGGAVAMDGTLKSGDELLEVRTRQ